MIDFGLGVTLGTISGSAVYNWKNDPRMWRNYPKIWRWTRQNDLISSAHHDEWLGKIEKDPTIKMYTINDASDSIGICGLTSIDLQNRNAEFSLYIAPDLQKNGHGRRSLLTLLYHGFMNLGLNMIWGETFSDNPAQKLFESIGMQRNGSLREAYFKNGKFCDILFYTSLAREFIEVHGVKSCFGRT